MKAIGSGLFLTACALGAPGNQTKPTWAKDVAPIVYNRCVECHRPGEVAPIAFTNYQEVRPWAKAIKECVVTRVMPPWLADPHFGTFRNDRRMSQQEIDTITAWVGAGAPEGDAKDLPALPKFEEGWNIGKPDLVVDIGTDFAVPANGVVPYKYFRVPSGFTEDQWIQAAEVRPGARTAIHHVIVFILEPGQKGITGEGGDLLTAIAPGEQPLLLRPGTAKLIKAGSTIMFQVHYTPNGKAATDRTRMGLKFAAEPPKYRFMMGRAMTINFKIPPNDGNYEVKSKWVAKEDVDLQHLMPHMHLRGKDFKYTVTFPDGRQEVILNVPRYDFNWQLGYELKDPLHLPKGTRIDCIAHFDNSVNNKYNPDPTKEVQWGDQTFEEMMIGWFGYVVPVQAGAARSAGTR